MALQGSRIAGRRVPYRLCPATTDIALRTSARAIDRQGGSKDRLSWTSQQNRNGSPVADEDGGKR